jgi:hypothetical protein
MMAGLPLPAKFQSRLTTNLLSGQEQISLALLKDDLVTASLISIADRRNRRVSVR